MPRTRGLNYFIGKITLMGSQQYNSNDNQIIVSYLKLC